MSGFVKIYGTKLLDSTLWLECWQARLVFLGMLALADRHGVVDIPGERVLAKRINLPPEDVRVGLGVLMEPDPDSRSPEEGGRRVLPLETGWRIVNYEKYREFRTERQEKARLRAAKWRREQGDGVRTRNARTQGVTPEPTEAEAKADAEAENSKPSARKRDRERELWDWYVALRAESLRHLGKRATMAGLSDAARGRVRKALRHIGQTLEVGPDAALAEAREFITAMCEAAVRDRDPGRFKTSHPLFAVGWIDPWLSARQGIEDRRGNSQTHDGTTGHFKISAGDEHAEGEQEL